MARRILRALLPGALILSLALNALMIGAAVRVWQLRGGGPGLIAQLDRETRRELVAALHSAPEVQVARDRLGAARGRLGALLAGNRREPSALEAAMADVRRATAALQEAAHAEMLAHAARR